MSQQSCDVLIVGAGLAGLTAAYNICKADKNLKVVLLEGRPRLGGRLKSINTPSGKKVDLGGMWFVYAKLLCIIDSLLCLLTLIHAGLVPYKQMCVHY